MKPKVLQFNDYHPIMNLSDELKGTELKLRELDCKEEYLPPYSALIYEGNFSSPSNQKAIEKWRNHHKREFYR